MYLVVGTGRCGCSRVARILQTRFGIDFGGAGEVGAHYPDGTWVREAQRVIDTGRILPPDQPGHITAHQWRLAMHRFTDSLIEPYGLNHPLGAAFIGDYLTMFPEARVIWCQRDLLDTARDYYDTHEVDDRAALFAVQSRFNALVRELAMGGVPHVAIDVTGEPTDDEIAGHLAQQFGLEEAA